MRITTLLTCALAGSLLFSACKKSDSDALPTNYRIDGVQDMTLQLSGSVPITGYMSISVVPTGKIKEHVNLSVEGLPEGCSSFITSPGGFPTFSSNIIIRDSDAVGGTYPVKLVCDGSVTGKKSYTFNLTLPEFPDCASWLVRNYSANSGCAGGTFPEYVTAGSTHNRIVFNNFENAGISLYANVTCQSSGSSASLVMPSQTVNGITFSGSGYAAPGYFYLSYNRYEPGVGSTSCTLYMY